MLMTDMSPRNGLPSDADDMEGHTLVLPDVPKGRSPFTAWVDAHIHPSMIALASRDMSVTNEAISAGLGMGFMGDYEASQRKDLHAALPPNPDWVVNSWIVTHVDLHRTEKVQAMLGSIKSFRAAT